MHDPELDEDELRPVDPFRVPWYGRVIGTCYWVFDVACFWLVWPFVAVWHAVSGVIQRLVWNLDRAGYRLQRSLRRGWWYLLEFVQVEGVRQRVSDMQQQAVRSVDDLASTVQQRTVRANWYRSMLERFAAVQRRGYLRWLDFLEWAERSAVTRLLTAPLRGAVWLGYSLSDFAQEWFWTRQFRHLLYGIPAVVLLMPLLYCAARMPFYTNQAKAKHYRAAADQAIEAEDFAAAELYFRKLAQLGDIHERVTLRAAMLAQEQGDTAAAYSQLKSLAPLDSRGVFEAHWWIAQSILSGRIEQQNPAAAELAERHLLAAAELRPEETSVQLLLADVARARGDLAAAAARLDNVDLDRLSWETRAKVANAFAQLGQSNQSRRIARGLVAHFDRESEQRTLAADEFLTWAVGYELQGEVGEAIQVLLAGVAAHPGEASLGQAAQQVGLTYVDHQPAATDEDWIRKRKILEVLLTTATDRTPLLTRVANLLTVPIVAADARRLLKAEESRGALPGEVYRVLADQAVVQQDWNQARQLYRRAVEASPELHGAHNNLAFILSHEPPEDLDQALQLADHAVELQPENPHYLETRGQIRVRLEQWPAAIEDLARALNGMPHKKEIHRSLALAYRELGQIEQAEQHRSQAER